MEHQSRPGDMLFTRIILERYTRLDLNDIRTLEDLYTRVIPLSQRLLFILHTLGDESSTAFPFDLPPLALEFGAIYTLQREIGETAFELTGRATGVHIKKWDRKEDQHMPEPKDLQKKSIQDMLNDEDFLLHAQPNIDMEVPTQTGAFLFATVHRLTDEFINPLNFPYDAKAQQRYMTLLQEVLTDLLSLV